MQHEKVRSGFARRVSGQVRNVRVAERTGQIDDLELVLVAADGMLMDDRARRVVCTDGVRLEHFHQVGGGQG